MLEENSNIEPSAYWTYQIAIAVLGSIEDACHNYIIIQRMQNSDWSKIEEKLISLVKQITADCRYAEEKNLVLKHRGQEIRFIARDRL